jgi:hypothetical protein
MKAPVRKSPPRTMSKGMKARNTAAPSPAGRVVAPISFRPGRAGALPGTASGGAGASGRAELAMKKGGMADKAGRAMKKTTPDAKGRAMKKGK